MFTRKVRKVDLSKPWTGVNMADLGCTDGEGICDNMTIGGTLCNNSVREVL